MVSDLPTTVFQLLNSWQHGFPLVSRPFRKLGLSLGLSEQAVLAYFQQWQQNGVLSRIGPVLNPSCLSSTLVGMHVPANRLDEVAAHISALPEVNHNYEREHKINLWFVIACAQAQDLQDTLEAIARETSLTPLSLPMLSGYHIDLGFSLAHTGKAPAQVSGCKSLPADGSPEQAMLRAVLHGLALVPEPYMALSEQVGMPEKQVLSALSSWLDQGLLRRFGVVLRHRSLGYIANAMCVWTVPEHLIDELGRRLATEPGVTLCYHRRPQPPAWTHNLFCMIHGKDRSQVSAQHARLSHKLGLERFPHDILFSSRCFKQRGAWLAPLRTHHD